MSTFYLTAPDMISEGQNFRKASPHTPLAFGVLINAHQFTLPPKYYIDSQLTRLEQLT